MSYFRNTDGTLFLMVLLVSAVLFACVSVSSIQTLSTSPLQQLAARRLLSVLDSATNDDKLDVIIHFKRQVNVLRTRSDIESRVLARTSGDISKSDLSDIVAQSLVHKLQSTARAEQKHMLAFLKSKAKISEFAVKSLWIANVIALEKVTISVLEELAAHFSLQIDYIEINPTITLPSYVKETAISPAPSAIQPGSDLVEENLMYIQAVDMWQLGHEGEGITLAVVDTGVDVDHPALKNNYRGKDSGHDHNWWDAYDHSRTPRDTEKHGTHCTGSMVGVDNSRSPHRLYGVAPKANFIGCQSLNGNRGSLSAALECWEFVLAPFDLNRENADTSKRAHIVSNSWGHEGYDPELDIFKSTADALRAAGIFVVVAAGNEGRRGCNTIASPGVYENVFTICAVDGKGSIASFSSRGPVPQEIGSYAKPDVCAPGVSIRSTIPEGGYTSYSGTSSSAPQVAAAVALLWGAIPELNRDVEKTEQLLKTSAEARSSAACGSAQSVPNHIYGHGIIMIMDAFNAHFGNFTPGPILNSADSIIPPLMNWLFIFIILVLSFP